MEPTYNLNLSACRGLTDSTLVNTNGPKSQESTEKEIVRLAHEKLGEFFQRIPTELSLHVLKFLDVKERSEISELNSIWRELNSNWKNDVECLLDLKTELKKYCSIECDGFYNDETIGEIEQSFDKIPINELESLYSRLIMLEQLILKKDYYGFSNHMKNPPKFFLGDQNEEESRAYLQKNFNRYYPSISSAQANIYFLLNAFGCENLAIDYLAEMQTTDTENEEAEQKFIKDRVVFTLEAFDRIDEVNGFFLSMSSKFDDPNLIDEGVQILINHGLFEEALRLCITFSKAEGDEADLEDILDEEQSIKAIQWFSENTEKLIKKGTFKKNLKILKKLVPSFYLIYSPHLFA